MPSRKKPKSSKSADGTLNAQSATMDSSDPMRKLLTHPPSHLGEAAIAALSTMRQWVPKRDEAFDALTEANAQLQQLVFRAQELSTRNSMRADPFSTAHAHVVNKYTDLIKAKRAEIQQWHEEFSHIDSILSTAQREIDTVYDSFFLKFLHAEAMEEQRQPQNNAEIEIEEERDDRTKEDLSKYTPIEILYKISKDPTLPSRNLLAKKLLDTICKFQARIRMKRRRRQYKSVAKARRICNVICIQYQFYYWKTFVRGEVWGRHRSYRLVIKPLQINANLAALRRTQFALHFHRLRETSTLKRVLAMWFRYVKYLNAPVDSETKKRDCHFDYELDQWNEFIQTEHMRLQLQQRGSAIVSGGDDYLVKAHYVARWHRFVERRQQKRAKIYQAKIFNNACVVAKHFHAWTAIVAYSAQREATKFAVQQYYFLRWNRAIHRITRERLKTKALQPLKKMSALVKWRKQAVHLRRAQSAATLVLQHNKSLALIGAYCIRKEEMNFKVVKMWKQWKNYTKRCRLWKTFIANYWQKRAKDLKSICFNSWLLLMDQKRVSKGEERKYPRKRKKLDHYDPKKDLLEEFVASRHHFEYVRIMENISRLSGMIKDLERNEEGPASFYGTDNIFARETPQLSVEQLEKERKITQANFSEWKAIHDWLPGCRDPHLSAVSFQLLVADHYAKRKKTTFLPQSAVTLGRLNEKQIWDNFTLMCVGQPIFNSRKLELCVSEMEEAGNEEAALNVIFRIRRQIRDARLLRKIEAQLSSCRYFQSSLFFSCYDVRERGVGVTPYNLLMEGYKNMWAERTKQKSQVSGRRPKYYIPLPELPKKKWLPFILRLHLQEFISNVAQENIRKRQCLHCRVARAVLQSKLAKLHFVQHRSTESEERRMHLLSKVVIFESRALKAERLHSKYHSLIPFKCLLADEQTTKELHQYNFLNLIGFNPEFLRGADHAEIHQVRRVRTMMTGVSKTLKELKLKSRLRRTDSDLGGGTRLIELEQERRAALPRYNSAPSLRTKKLLDDYKSSKQEEKEKEFDELVEEQDLEFIKTVQSLHTMIASKPGTPDVPGEKPMGSSVSSSMIEESEYTSDEEFDEDNTSFSESHSHLSTDNAGKTAMSSLKIHRSLSGDPGSHGSHRSDTSSRSKGSGDDLLSSRSHESQNPLSPALSMGSHKLSDGKNGTHFGGTLNNTSFSSKLGSHRPGSSLSVGSKGSSGNSSKHSKRSIAEAKKLAALDTFDLSQDYLDSDKKGHGSHKKDNIHSEISLQGDYTSWQEKKGSQLQDAKKGKELEGVGSHTSQPTKLGNIPGALQNPSINLRVELQSKEEILAKRAARRSKKMERESEKQGKSPRLVCRLMEQKVGPLFERDPTKNTVRSLERLLELSVRHGAGLCQETTLQIKEAKESLQTLMASTDDDTRAQYQTVNKLAGAERQLMSQLVGIGQDTKNQDAAETAEKESKVPKHFARQPLYSTPQAKFPYRRQKVPDGDEEAALPSSPKQQNQAHHATKAGTESAPPILVDTEPVRRQLLRVPHVLTHNAALQDVHMMMESTAVLINDTLLSSGDRTDKVSLSDEQLEIIRRHKNENRVEPLEWDRPWREEMEMGHERRASTAMGQGRNKPKKKLAARDLIVQNKIQQIQQFHAEALAAKKRALSAERRRGAEEKEVIRIANLPLTEEQVWENWLATHKKKLLDQRYHASSQEELTVHRKLLQHQIFELKETLVYGGIPQEDKPTVRTNIAHVKTKLGEISQLLEIEEPNRQDPSNPFLTRFSMLTSPNVGQRWSGQSPVRKSFPNKLQKTVAETRDNTIGKEAKHQLSDTEVSRIVEHLVKE